jgi:hypothetical protein
MNRVPKMQCTKTFFSLTPALDLLEKKIERFGKPNPLA